MAPSNLLKLSILSLLSLVRAQVNLVPANSDNCNQLNYPCFGGLVCCVLPNVCISDPSGGTGYVCVEIGGVPDTYGGSISLPDDLPSITRPIVPSVTIGEPYTPTLPAISQPPPRSPQSGLPDSSSAPSPPGNSGVVGPNFGSTSLPSLTSLPSTSEEGTPSVESSTTAPVPGNSGVVGPNPNLSASAPGNSGVVGPNPNLSASGPDTAAVTGSPPTTISPVSPISPVAPSGSPAPSAVDAGGVLTESIANGGAGGGTATFTETATATGGGAGSASGSSGFTGAAVPMRLAGAFDWGSAGLVAVVAGIFFG